MGKLLLSLLLGSLSLLGADAGPPLLPASDKPDLRLWRTSVAALATANIMDVQSSWGKRELNPALAGRGGAFGTRGVLLKAGITGGVVLLEFLVMRRKPSKKLRQMLTVVNFGDAALTGAVAGRNWGVARR